MESIDRLAAVPSFFRSRELWDGALDPRLSLDTTSPFRKLREFSSAHAWGIKPANPTALSPLTGKERVVTEVALGLLLRGAWTLCSWRVEQWLATKFEATELGELKPINPTSGTLGYAVKLKADAQPRLRHALIAARLPGEVTGDSRDVLKLLEDREGIVASPAEAEYWEQVLAPALGFPLLDMVRFQAPVDYFGEFAGRFEKQRVDFSIETGRGLRLVIEVDGEEHHSDPQQKTLDTTRRNALRTKGWNVLEAKVHEYRADIQGARRKLLEQLSRVGSSAWAYGLDASASREQAVQEVVWGATAIARLQFLVLKALLQGVLSTTGPQRVSVSGLTLELVRVALDDLYDWFGRLRRLYSLPEMPRVELLVGGAEAPDLAIAISCTSPFLPEGLSAQAARAFAWSRPFNGMAPEPMLKFSSRNNVVDLPAKELLESFAKDLFRKTGFREGQYEILSRLLQGRSVVGLLPTGGGKSLTYQLAALLLPGATLYVAPLKSLLQDQFERFKGDGVDACTFLSSALSTTERLAQEQRFSRGAVRMLQVAPERFLMADFRSLLDSYRANHGDIAQVVVDEAHCASEWGHDFRPAYLSLSRIVRERTSKLGSSAPVAALTGTASTIVLDDIRRELDIREDAAIVRASRLDRPELTLRFAKMASDSKGAALINEAEGFLREHPGAQDGLLVFTQHVNGKFGVFELTTKLASKLGLEANSSVRLYSGEAPKSFAELTGHAVDGATWETMKAQTQRAFISPTRDSFKVLVATSAFGMGIDKPSIRKIIHYLAPSSPEAYYQEVGRAARDREPAEALLLFSDEQASDVDQILSPETDIDSAKHLYEQVGWKSGDFLTTFYFHKMRFEGIQTESPLICSAIKEVTRLVDKDESLVIQYKSRGDWRAEEMLEYSLVRLIHLGILADYTKDFRTKTFAFTAAAGWTEVRTDLARYREYLASNLEAYIRRYETRQHPELIDPIFAAATLEEAERAAVLSIVTYLYSQIERRRRTASRTMLEIIRQGVTDAEAARTRLLLYLQTSEKFTRQLEEMAHGEQISMAWSEIAKDAESPAEVDELHGAVSRVLESFPTHPGLLLLSAISRRRPGPLDIARSREELGAALQELVSVESADVAAAAAEEAIARCVDIDRELSDSLRAPYVRWCLPRFGGRYAVEKAAGAPEAQVAVLTGMLIEATKGLPSLLH
jgi:ATP-dependent DNA helicase RecQ